jgi:archaellum component FlaG (FlaF/FlaG flagellin family)
MKKIIFFFLSFIHLSSFAQNIQILNKQDSTEVPYVNVVYFVHDSIVGGTYTDEDGKVTLEIPLQCNTIEFSAMGYDTVKINKNTLNPIMYLEELPLPLHEITLTSSKIKKEKTTKLGYPIKDKGRYYSVWGGLEVVTLFKPDTQDQRKLSAFLFYLKNIGSETPDGYASVFRIVFYENVANKPHQPIHLKDEKQQVFTINAKQYGKIKLNIDHLNITLPQEGLFIGIEYIGFIEANSKDIRQQPKFKEDVLRQPLISFLKLKQAEKSYTRTKFNDKYKNWSDANKIDFFPLLKENEHYTPAFAIEVY